MTESKIAKDRLAKFLAAISEEYAVYGPVEEGDVVAFRRVHFAEEMQLDYRNSTVSPKDLFLPRAEVVYEFDGQDFVNDVLPDEKRVIFALRPCDCRALTLLDNVLDTDEVKDPFYVARRQNTVLIALGCSRPLSTCFCTALGGDPFGEEGADVLLGDAGDSMLVRTLTPKGEDFLKRYGKLTSGGKAGDWEKPAKEARGRIKHELEVKGISSHLGGLFEDDVWEAISRNCLGCGMCSCLCPTCYCFDLADRKTATGSKKIRRQDCCMFGLFTLHASGHNPRADNTARLRQKVMHKFTYYAERYGVNSCVGCGRCIRSCPVNLDIRQVLSEVMALQGAKAEK